MKKTFLLILILACFVVSAAAQDAPTLMQRPTVNRTHIVFVYAGDLWSVPRAGGAAERLTTGPGIESSPQFSPDGQWVAFNGQYDGNLDLFVVPAAGGVPKRLTWHPGPDQLVGWTPDGKHLVFRSSRTSYTGVQRLFKLSLDGGLPEELPFPMGFEGSMSPDGNRIAYMPLAPAFAQWKNYRGGRQTKIWVVDLKDSNWFEIPRTNSNDYNPLWIGEKIFFLSDRNGAVTLFSYDLKTKRVAPAIQNSGLDIKSASAGPDAIAYEQFGKIHLYDPASGKSNAVNITVSGDMPYVRPRYERVAGNIAYYGISATGARAVFGARGEILSVPAEKGNIRNLTNTPGVMERDPAWSPDGKWIAYFSDESGEYALHLRDQTGMGEVKKISLGSPSSYFYAPTWSPDSKKIAFTDKRLNLWYVEIEKGAPVKVDTNTFENPFRVMDPQWSPDSKWITYTKQLKNRLGAVHVYSLETAKSTQITDGLSDARFANFDRGGKHLYFTASTDAGPSSGWLDMSSFPHQVTRSVYLIVLAKGDESPLAPESDEEKVAEEKKDGAPAAPKPGEKKEVEVKIDFDGISQRILALPIPARNYVAMRSGKAGAIFLLEAVANQPGATLHRFELSKRRPEKVLDGVTAWDLSANGEKMLFAQGAPVGFGAAPPRFVIAPAMTPMRPGEGALNLTEMEVRVDPKAEWTQMYREAWRVQRDFFYDPTFHGLDIKAAEKKYEPYLSAVAHRADLTYLFQEMLGNMSVGHHNAGGGDIAQPRAVPGGLLGADYKIENGRYRFAKVYNGENWNPQLRAPLTQPGVDVKEGEYLLAVNGRELGANDNVYAFFENTANKSVMIKVGPNADGSDSREVKVVPVANEGGLRNLAWIEGNRRKVDEMTGGRVAYVYLPNTSGAGYANFNRYYFAQIDKYGAVIDERFNGGGTAADYMVDYMRRPLMNYWATREGEFFTTPVGSIYGPKAMIINEWAGSGGDMLPWLFRKAGVGKLVGKRTWGGLVGIYDYPQLMDGGGVTAPRVAFFNTEGQWDVENYGTAPDIEVEMDPKSWREGRDPQLERAVQVVLEEMKRNPQPKPKLPAYPNYYNGTTTGAPAKAGRAARPGVQR
ncbi:MAG: PD40 domain-containing protein [Blastocatellales bacterium]|nr:PD40 domain-containing protein [Blastocatellales bacterium]